MPFLGSLLSLHGSYKGEIKMTVQENEMIQNTEKKSLISMLQSAEETFKLLRQQQDQLLKQEVLLAEKDVELAKVKSALAEKTMELAKVKTLLADKDMELVKAKAGLSEKDTALFGAKAALAEKDARIAALVSESEKLKQSSTRIRFFQ